MTIYEFAPKAKSESHTWICDGDTFLTDDGNFVEIKWDCDCESPREYGNFGTFYTWMNSYSSPDEAPSLEDLFDEYGLWDEWDALDADNDRLIDEYESKRREYQREFADVRHRIETNDMLNKAHAMMASAKGEEWTWTNFFDWMDGDPFAYPVEPKKPLLKRKPNPVAWFATKLNELGHVALPVSAYCHSGITYSVGSPSQFPDSQWDAGYAGVIFVEAEKVCSNDWCADIHEITPETRKVINRYLADEVDYYDEWAQGHTYGYAMYDRSGDEIDSCWGFIGDDAVTNGIEDYTGSLTETSMSLDDWIEMNEKDDDAA